MSFERQYCIQMKTKALCFTYHNYFSCLFWGVCVKRLHKLEYLLSDQKKAMRKLLVDKIYNASKKFYEGLWTAGASSMFKYDSVEQTI